MKSGQQRAESNRYKKCSVEDTTHDKEASEICLNAAETYPRTPNRHKHEAVDMTSVISDKRPTSQCIMDEDITQLENAEVCNRQNEKQALDCECEDDAVRCRKITDLHELQEECEKTNKNNERRLLHNSFQKQEAQRSEQTEVKELEDYSHNNKDSKMTLVEDSSSRRKTEVLELEDAYIGNKKNDDMRFLKNSPTTYEIQGTEEMKPWKCGHHYKESNKDYEIKPLKDPSAEAQCTKMMELQEFVYDYKANNKDNLVRLVDDFTEKCQAHGRGTMEVHACGAGYKRSEPQDEDKHVRSSVNLTKISSVRKEIVSTMTELNAFKSECQLQHNTTVENKEYAKQKIPTKETLEIKWDDGEQVEKAITAVTQEVNKGAKETAVMEHSDTEKAEKITEMSSHARNKEEASVVQIKRYVSSSLELQLIQDK
jgi:hypothetical protein